MKIIGGGWVQLHGVPKGTKDDIKGGDANTANPAMVDVGHIKGLKLSARNNRLFIYLGGMPIQVWGNACLAGLLVKLKQAPNSEDWDKIIKDHEQSWNQQIVDKN